MKQILEVATHPNFTLAAAIIIHICMGYFFLVRVSWNKPEEFIEAYAKNKPQQRNITLQDVDIGLTPWGCLPFWVLGLSAFLNVQGKLIGILVGLLFICFLLRCVYVLFRYELACILFMSYAEVSALIWTVFCHSFLIFLFMVKDDIHFSFYSFWPVFCLIECLLGILALFKTLKKPSKAFLAVPAKTTAFLMVIQSIFVLFFWIWGTLGLINIQLPPLYKISWSAWISSLLFVHTYPSPALFSLGLFFLIILTLFLNGKYVLSCRRNHSTKDCLKYAVLGFLTIGFLCAGILFLSFRPNYVKSTISLKNAVFVDEESQWSKPKWDTSKNCLANILPGEGYDMDGHEMIFPDGVTMYFDSEPFIVPISYTATLHVLDDFSGRPYLRLYANMKQDGQVSFYAENQGGMAAQDCNFTINDDKDLLKNYFSLELLHTQIAEIKPGETVCLVTLRNQDMVRPCYQETEIRITVSSSFRSELNFWRSSRQIAGSTLLSLRGITNAIIPAEDHNVNTHHWMTVTDTWETWSGQLEPQDLGIHTTYTFQSESTSILALFLKFETYWGQSYTLPPLVFLYEAANGEGGT